ncbi:MAG: hypothetical protein J2P21_26890, partial [Chloracidobacterium sp.]|nr:hypothetical protein [Chloracidobacterium sp.]
TARALALRGSARAITGHARSLGYLSNGQLQGWDIPPNQISQAWPGAPYETHEVNFYVSS